MEASSTIRTIPWEDINLLGNKVGEGTIGYVHKAELISEARRIVAVKRMRNNAVACVPEEGKKILLEEARLMSKLHHHHIVSIIGLIFFPNAGIQDFPAIVIEYMPSGSLRKDEAHRAFPLRIRVRMAIQIAEAMQYIHSAKKSIVHNDLHSGNIFMDLTKPEQPMCKLGDFGMGQELDKKSMLGNYERDVHSFGVLFHNLLAGKGYAIDLNNCVKGLKRAVLLGKQLVDDCSRKLPDSDEVVERLHKILDAIPADEIN